MKALSHQSKPLLVLLPGFRGSPRQAVLESAANALPSYEAKFPGLPSGPPSERLAREVAFVNARVGDLARPVLLVGRSFGARVAVRYALSFQVRALALVGFPIRPPGRKRPDDENALANLRVPTLILQGDRDELGPLRILRPIVAQNPWLRLEVLKGCEHRLLANPLRTAMERLVAFVESLD